MEVWAIGVYNEDEPMGYDAIEMFGEALDLNLPVLADNGNASHQYPLDQAFPSAAFPKQFVVGRDGTIIYVNNRYEYDSLKAVLESER